MPGDRAEGGDGPGQGVLGGVLADPVLARVHQRGDLRGVGAAFGVGDGGELRGPRAGRERDQGAEAVAEAGVDDAGDVAGSGQVPLADRGGQDLPGVQPGQFGGAQRAPQPFGLVAGLGRGSRAAGLAMSRSWYRWSRAGVVSAVQIACSRARWSASDRAWFLGLGGGQLLAVAFQHAGQHGEGLPGCRRWGRAGRRVPAVRRSWRASSGAGRGPGTGSASFGDSVNTYARLTSVPRVRAT